VVFVAGEAGIGKTALVDAFLARRTSDPSCLVAHGQGVEQFSTAEPYLPLLDALGRLATSEHGRRFARVLARLAPSWKGLLPGLSDGGESPAAPASPESMLREMVRAIEAVESPLVLVLEDLHWSDYATLDVLHRLARGRAPAPILVVVTYRAAELAMREHPLKTMHRELRAQSLCQDVWLPPLATGAIGDYVARRFPGLENVAELAGQIASRTDGNALFMVNVTDELETAGTVVRSEAGWKLDGNVTDIATAVPPGLRQLLVMRTDRLDAQDRDLLEACSVVGRVSCAEEAAAALELPVHEVDTALATVARRHFLLRDAGQSTWPDGSVSGRYEFAHSLYRDVLLEQAPPARRRLWHERVARRIEAGYRGRTTEVASILARHLEAAGLGDAAIPYLEEAAERAWRYGAEREGVALLDHAVAILESLPKSPERMLKTIRLSIGLGQVLQASHGYASRDSETAFARAWKLADELDDVVQLFQASVGLISSYVGKARFEDARRVAERLPELMSQIPLPPFTLAGHLFIGIASYHSGLLTKAQAHFDAALAVGEVVQPAIITNFHVVLLSYRALTFAHRENATRRSRARSSRGGEPRPNARSTRPAQRPGACSSISSSARPTASKLRHAQRKPGARKTATRCRPLSGDSGAAGARRGVDRQTKGSRRCAVQSRTSDPLDTRRHCRRCSPRWRPLRSRRAVWKRRSRFSPTPRRSLSRAAKFCSRRKYGASRASVARRRATSLPRAIFSNERWSWRVDRVPAGGKRARTKACRQSSAVAVEFPGRRRAREHDAARRESRRVATGRRRTSPV
jgi:hypothetical protein